MPPAEWTPSPGGSWPVHDARPKRSGMALAALICGLAGLVLCFLVVPSVVAVVLGLVAAGQIKRSGGLVTGLGAARAGWITGIVGLAIGAAFFTSAALGVFDDDGDVAVFDLDVGDCVRIDIGEEQSDVETLPVVGCDEPHDGEVVATGELDPGDDEPYPDDATLFDMVEEACARDHGGDPALVVPIAPDERAWNVADAPYVCIRVVR